MAHIVPPDYNTPGQAGVHESERQTLEYLAEALPDTYTVFSSVLWARAHDTNTRVGEIDFCVVSPAGQLVVIEQKSGGLSVQDGKLIKRYGLTEKDAGKQIMRSIGALKDAWKAQHHGQTLAIDYLIYTPDYQLRQVLGPQLNASRIVHAGSSASLAQALQKLCGEAAANPSAEQAMHQFISGVLKLELDIGHLQSHQDRLYRRYEDTLLAWVNRLSFTPYVLRVDGCAGSGKTQLGIGLFRQARARGEDARYVCFNRPLADSLAQAVGEPLRILSRDRFYDVFLRSQQVAFAFDSSDPDRFIHLENQVASLSVPPEWQVDVLIIDEAQDIPARSLAVLRRFLRPQGRLVWLEDRAQNLYEHEPLLLPGAVELQLDQCFRSPTAILKFLHALFPLKRTLIPANPHYGEEPQFFSTTASHLAATLTQRVHALITQGATPRDIAIISLRGIQSSALRHCTHVGEFSLSRPTGEYSATGQQIWTEGDIVVDSVFRFKGNQRPYILLIDADFPAINDDVVRRFYCGMTRATLGVDIFMTPEFDQVLRASLA